MIVSPASPTAKPGDRIQLAVQIVFAGKAHPADEAGKHHLQNVFKQALDPQFAGRVAFIDDYDLHMAHFLVQGCDVWLNNPRKPLEASGTSGMKASMNGTLHLSIGDGWWAEGFDGTNGWLIEAQAADSAAGTPAFRIFYVSGGLELSPGNLTLIDLTLANGLAQGGDGSFNAGGGLGAGGIPTRVHAAASVARSAAASSARPEVIDGARGRSP